MNSTFWTLLQWIAMMGMLKVLSDTSIRPTLAEPSFPRKNLSLRHDKISWKGFTPQLNFRYLKIDSNMKSFYTRKNTQIFMSVEKDFK